MTTPHTAPLALPEPAWHTTPLRGPERITLIKQLAALSDEALIEALHSHRRWVQFHFAWQNDIRANYSGAHSTADRIARYECARDVAEHIDGEIVARFEAALIIRRRTAPQKPARKASAPRSKKRGIGPMYVGTLGERRSA